MSVLGDGEWWGAQGESGLCVQHLPNNFFFERPKKQDETAIELIKRKCWAKIGSQ
jgi:hypothetical protein